MTYDSLDGCCYLRSFDMKWNMEISMKPVAPPVQQFVRQTSGLVKEFGAGDTFVFNTLGYALGLVLASLPVFLGGIYPNANIYIVLTLGTILTVFNGLVYGLFSAAMPRSGGDYVFVSRTLSPGLGFVANWGFSWSQFLGLGVYTAWCVTDALSPALVTLGYSLSSPELIEAGESLLQPFNTLIAGSLLLLSVLIVSLAGTKFLKRFSNFFFVFAMIGTAVMAFVLLTTTREEFVIAFNSIMNTEVGMKDAYDGIIQMAQENGLETESEQSLWDSILALPIGYWAFIGFTYSAYVGGEVKQPQRSQTVGIVGALIVGYIAYMVTLGGYYGAVGQEFTNAVAVVQGLESNPLPTSGSMSFFAGISTDSALFNVLIGLSTFLWFYLLLFVMAAICVRNLFAWSFDRLAPELLSNVSSKRGAPWIATLVVIAIAFIFMFIQVTLGLTFMNYIALFSVCFLITGIAAIVFPFKRSDIYNQAPPIVRTRLFNVPLMSIAGVINTILFVFVLYSALTNPGISGVAGLFPTTVVMGIYGAGIIYYLVAKALKKNKGIDLAALQSEIPPD